MRSMNGRIFLIIALAANLFACAVSLDGSQRGAPALNAENSPAPAYDTYSLRSELLQLSRTLERKPSPRQMGQLAKSLPPSWVVNTPEKNYTISTAALRNDLDAGSADKAEAWVWHMEEIEGSDAGSAASSTGARADLTQILAGSQFGSARPQGPIDKARARIYAWLNEMLAKLFGNIARHPMGAEILFWVLLLGAVAAIALFVYRLLSGNDRMDALQQTATILPQRSWQEWLRAARQAADRKDFREAVHSVYWSAITRLQETGVVPRDRAKTPREYLRIVVESSAAETGAMGSDAVIQLRPPLQALTSRFERIWYANGAAGAPDFQESVQQLKELGCPLD